MPQETYHADRIRQLATELGNNWTATGIVLAEGETAWNPASTKGPLYGPGVVEYHMHTSGIDIREEDVTVKCMGGDRLEEWPYWRNCQEDREDGTTRCHEHRLSRYASVN